MDTLVDTGNSSRRGSLNSLHRQSSGSLSSRSASGHAPLPKDPVKDLEKFTKYFVIKTFQAIIQSRVDTFKQDSTECKPNGNDWFNLNIKDVPEINEQTKSLIELDRFSIKSNWRLCCEISLRARDGGTVVLEYWVISHRSLFRNYIGSLKEVNIQTDCNNQNQHPSTTRARVTRPQGSFSPNTGHGQNYSPDKSRTSTFTNGTRTRLNTMNDQLYSDGLSSGNCEIKPSTSCYSLTTSMTEAFADMNVNQNKIVSSATSNSINKLASNNQTTNHTLSKPKTIASVLSTMQLSGVYNRMTLLLKSIMTTSHIVPAYQLASGITEHELCEITYQIYYVNSHQSPTSSSSRAINDKLNELGHQSSRPKVSANSLSPISINQFVCSEDVEKFCPFINLGCAKTELNEIEVSLCYRTDVRNSFQLAKTSPQKGMCSGLLDRDCIIAAKQLLAANSLEQNFTVKSESSDLQKFSNSVERTKCPDEPLKPAFANSGLSRAHEDPDLPFIEPMFDSLLRIKDEYECSDTQNKSKLSKSNVTLSSEYTTKTSTKPIDVRVNRTRPETKSDSLNSNQPSGSTPKSLTDSFVFVELNPPFASDEQNEINSFFHNPSLVFNLDYDCLKDADDMTSELAGIEADADQIDEFVDHICLSENEDEEESGGV